MPIPLKDLKDNFPMSELCTVGVGGVAKHVCFIRETDDLLDVLQWCKDLSMPVTIIGGGSNILMQDGDYDGMIIRLMTDCISWDANTARVDAGYPVYRLIKECAERGLSGLEDLHGVPGTVGGGVYGNAGSHSQCFADLIVSVDVLTKDGEIKELSRGEIEYSYRSSSFKTSGDGSLILGAELAFIPGEKDEIYNRMESALCHKKEAQPWENACGSYFENPEGDSAWRLIDECGLRGYVIGGAEVSNKHSNFLVNAGGATRGDFDALEQHIKESVKAKFGIDLKREVRKMGEDF